VIQPAAVDRLVDQFEAGEFDLAAIGRACWRTRRG